MRAIADSGVMPKIPTKMPTLPASTMPKPAGVNGTVLNTADASAVKSTAEGPIAPAAGSTWKSPSAAATAPSRSAWSAQITHVCGATRTIPPRVLPSFSASKARSSGSAACLGSGSRLLNLLAGPRAARSTRIPTSASTRANTISTNTAAGSSPPKATAPESAPRSATVMRSSARSKTTVPTPRPNEGPPLRFRSHAR